MAGLFETPRWDRQPSPVGLELSRTHRDIHHALEQTSLFQTGLQAVPQARKQVSLQAVGSVAPTGPAVVGSPETMRLVGSGSGDPIRERMIDVLQTPGRGWQFGPLGSQVGEPAKPQLTPASAEKPALVGGIPTGNPRIKVGSEDVRVGGFVISPQGTIETSIPSLTGLAPLASLAVPQLQTGSLATGTAIEDVSKITTPTTPKLTASEELQAQKPTLGVSIATSLIPPVAVPSAVLPSVEQASLGTGAPVVPEVAPLPPEIIPSIEVPGAEEGGGDDGGGGEGGGGGGEGEGEGEGGGGEGGGGEGEGEGGGDDDGGGGGEGGDGGDGGDE